MCFSYEVWSLCREYCMLLCQVLSRNSSVGIATGYGLDDRRGEMVKNFHFSITSRPALGSTQPPIKWVSGALSRG
jgi:hypothetical protein